MTLERTEPVRPRRVSGVGEPARLKVAVFTKYGRLAASTRQRFVQYHPFVERSGIDFTYYPLFDNDYLAAMLRDGKKPFRIALRSYARRLSDMSDAGGFNATIVHCDLLPYLPALLESVFLRAKVPIIYDFDDAIFHQYDNHSSFLVRAVLGKKLQPLLSRAVLATCGNAYLQAYAARFCRHTEVVPTVVDSSIYIPRTAGHPRGPVTVGWIGSPTTWQFVRPVLPVLRDLAEELDLRIRVVGAGVKEDSLRRFEFLEWNEAQEVEMIQGMDIGIMPLPDEPWARGKCGYKLIQYMGCAVPTIASPVGVNASIVDHRVNGFHARTKQEWVDAIRGLCGDPRLRRDMGARGRLKVEEAYSLQAHGPRFAAMLRNGILGRSG